jgi:uncharacterized protein YxjI
MLNRQHFFIREHTGLLKLTDFYDILDPATRTKLGDAREEIPGWVKVLRLLVGKQLLPTRVAVYEGSGEQAAKLVFSIRRGVALLRPKVHVVDAAGVPVGYLRSKTFSLGGAFRVFTPDGTEIAQVKGDWKGWNFRFLAGETELGVVTKQWAGLGKELFTTADNYMISLRGAPDPSLNILLLAAGLAIDTVLKEQN